MLEVGYAFAETPYLAGLLRSGIDLVGADLATREVDGMATVEADVRELPFDDRWFDQILLVSTLEHVGFDEEPREPDKARTQGSLRCASCAVFCGATAASS